MPHKLTEMRRQAAAFTLIELLVVIAIVALLISLLMPALAKARQRTVVIQCASNLRQVGMAIHMYANDNKNVIPSGYNSTPGNHWDWDFLTNSNWGEEFRATSPWLQIRDLDYLTPRSLYQCPATLPSQFPRTDNFKRSFSVTVGQTNSGWPTVNGKRIGQPSGQIARLDDGRIIKAAVLCCPLYTPDSTGFRNKWWGHDVNTGVLSGGNTLFLDNHVRWRDYEGYYTANAASGSRLARGLP